MNSRSLIKDSLLAVAILGIFCCFVLVAQAYQMTIEIESQVETQTAESEKLKDISYKKTVEESRNVVSSEMVTGVVEDKEQISIESKAEIGSIPEAVIETVISKTVLTKEVEQEPVTVALKEKLIPLVLKAEPDPVVEKVVITAPTKIPEISDYAEELVNLIESATNSFRRDNNLLPLRRESVLEQNASKYSQVLLSGNFMSHTDKSGCDLTCRFAADGYVAQSWGENLAMVKFDDTLSVTEVANMFMSGWRKSSGHRANLLSSDFTHQGVGVAKSNGAIYVVVQFSKLPN